MTFETIATTEGKKIIKKRAQELFPDMEIDVY